MGATILPNKGPVKARAGRCKRAISCLRMDHGMSNESHTVGLVGCASQELRRPAPARELYVSQLFKKASAYAELTCDRWYVLSAKHGLVHPDTVLEPYDMKLGTNDRTSSPIHAWCNRVREQLAAELSGLENVTLTVLAGEQYRYAVYGSHWPHELPMVGMGIGQQLGWLTEQLAVGVGEAG